jgi:glycosyltransferase involved in cell wall biosynthesis
VTAVSVKLLEKVRSALRDPELPGVMVPNAAPFEAIQENAAAPRASVPQRYIVTVGHTIYRKGVDVLLRALGTLRSRGLRVPLVVVGDGPDRADFERLAIELGVAEDVHFVGTQPHDQAIALIKASLFFVLASRAEGLPLVIAEAMACRKTVVATAVDGVPEIVLDGDTGLLVPSEDSDALAVAIGRLWTDDDYRHRLTAQAYERARTQFSWNVVADRYLDIFARIHARPRGRSTAP